MKFYAMMYNQMDHCEQEVAWDTLTVEAETLEQAYQRCLLEWFGPEDERDQELDLSPEAIKPLPENTGLWCTGRSKHSSPYYDGVPKGIVIGLDQAVLCHLFVTDIMCERFRSPE